VVQLQSPGKTHRLEQQTHRLTNVRFRSEPPRIATPPKRKPVIGKAQAERIRKAAEERRRRYLVDEARGLLEKQDYEQAAAMIQKMLKGDVSPLTRNALQRIMTEVDACKEVQKAIYSALRAKTGKEITLECVWTGGRIRYKITGVVDNVEKGKLFMTLAFHRTREINISEGIVPDQQNALATSVLSDNPSTWLKIGICWLNRRKWEV